MRRCWLLGGIGAGLVATGALMVGGGPVDPPVGPVGPTMHTLDEIHGSIEDLTGQVGGLEMSVPLVGDDLLFAALDCPPREQWMFMQIDGVEGEVTQHPYEGSIGVVNVSGSVYRPASTAVLNPIRVLCELDTSFPWLLRSAADGRHIPTVTFVFTTTAETPVEFVRITLTDVIASVVQPVFQVDKIVVEFHAVRVQYGYRRLDANGQPAGSWIEFCWDVVRNAPC